MDNSLTSGYIQGATGLELYMHTASGTKGATTSIQFYKLQDTHIYICKPYAIDAIDVGVWAQVACEFADLHDRVGGMRAMRAVSGSVVWPSARQFFYWRLRRRLVEEGLVKDLVAADGRSAARSAGGTFRD